MEQPSFQSLAPHLMDILSNTVFVMTSERRGRLGITRTGCIFNRDLIYSMEVMSFE